MKKIDKDKLFREWNKKLQKEGLGVKGETPSTDALNPFAWHGEYHETSQMDDEEGQGNEDFTRGTEGPDEEGRPCAKYIAPFTPEPDQSPLDPDLIAAIDPACDPRSGGIGGYGTKGLKKIRDAAGFSYNPSSWHAKMKNETWDFVIAVTSDGGLTSPKSVDNIDEAVFYTNIASAEEAGRQERGKIKKARQEWVPGWFKTDPSRGSGK
ncbi:MAG TPA: hypothetical protein VI728_09800 [Syntrophales bacterium]|nr:hypothetical protein [Syntrophales bacterium]